MIMDGTMQLDRDTARRSQFVTRYSARYKCLTYFMNSCIDVFVLEFLAERSSFGSYSKHRGVRGQIGF